MEQNFQKVNEQYKSQVNQKWHSVFSIVYFINFRN